MMGKSLLPFPISDGIYIVQSRPGRQLIWCLCCCLSRIILETDAAAIAARVSRPKADTTDIVINEQTLMNACTCCFLPFVISNLDWIVLMHCVLRLNFERTGNTTNWAVIDGFMLLNMAECAALRTWRCSS